MTTLENNYESCLFDHDDHGYCGVVHANHYSVEHAKTQQKPESQINRPAEKDKEFGKKF